jgi:5-methylcytosine-specific restriction endonuclease McrA
MSRLKTLKPRIQAIGGRLPVMQAGSWRADKQTSAQRGYGYRWQKARAAYLAEHPLCVYCEREGKVTAATVVDHKIPHRGDQELFWDEKNWQSLCKPCHDVVKRLEEERGVIDGDALISVVRCIEADEGE